MQPGIEISKGRENVHQEGIYFYGVDMKGDWSDSWKDWFGFIGSRVQSLIEHGYGVLDVNIQKTEPSGGILCACMITYWDKL